MPNTEEKVSVHELAGKIAPRAILANIPRLVASYYTGEPDVSNPAEQVVFGTSGHRGSSLKNSFNEGHVAAICKSICEYRKGKGIKGPLFIGMDTHALSEPALMTALEVFAAGRVTVMVQRNFRYTPTPVISHAILTYNRGRKNGFADGVIISPSHNPPEDGGIKYNPPDGGPADTGTTAIIEKMANDLLAAGVHKIRRMPLARALKSGYVREYDYVQPYISDLVDVVDMDAIRNSGIRIGVDPLGGAGVDFWAPLAELYGLSLQVVNTLVDPTFSFMTVDKDGKIRMDCSSPYAMEGLVGLKERFDIAFGNDTDADRHGIVTKSEGLMNPNHFLAAAVWFLCGNRPHWKKDAAIGKTIVTTAMIDRLAAVLGRGVCEVPVGFKWFVEGLLSGDYGFGGEESAGASFLRKDGAVWTTDKDGIIMGLLAAEMTAKTGKDPAELYRDLENRFGAAFSTRIDAPATAAQKKALKNLSPEAVSAKELAGEPILARLTQAPGNGAEIGGLKVVAANGWFAARPSGTEDIYKIYAESFVSNKHLDRLVKEAAAIVDGAFKQA
ncbi:MAG: phosphoglucomutase (alpha-D-glucose-1,6-bisphosphate-dependent) [Syntrophobacterales bacterium]|nr:phosphoglucomutase (alpha-D-glucose-1,6-bisphosphate-dependent) [Syntrophobacterales bacterium]